MFFVGNYQFLIISIETSAVSKQLSAISDSLVIEVYVNNKQASAGEVQDVLLERWQLKYYATSFTGSEVWTGWMNSVETTLNSMMRRVAVSARMTQVLRLLKKATSTQYEVKYKILSTASTLYFGPTDDAVSVIFHGHAPAGGLTHKYWSMGKNATLSFIMTYRKNAWNPRTMPTHIGQAALKIIDDYMPGGSFSPVAAAAPLFQGSPLPQASSSAPRLHSPHLPPLPHHHLAHQPPLLPQQHHPQQAQHQRVGSAGLRSPPPPPGEFNDYSAAPPQASSSSSGAMHSAYFGDIPSNMGGGSSNVLFTHGAPTTSPPYASSLPKHSYLAAMADQQGYTHSSPLHGPTSDPTAARAGGNTAAAATGTSPHTRPGQSPTDRVPGTSPTSDDPRPIRVRSSSTSASPLIGSTSISPYRADLSATLAKSPPTHSVLPLDMMGPPVRAPSSGRLSGFFGSVAPITTTLTNRGGSQGPASPFAASLDPSSSAASLSEHVGTSTDYNQVFGYEDFWTKLKQRAGTLPIVIEAETPFIANARPLSHDRVPSHLNLELYTEIKSFISPIKAGPK